MGFWQRLWDIVRGNANSALDHIEDPEKSLDVAISDMSREVAEFRQRVGSALVDQKRLVAELETNLGKSDEWGRRAAAAVAAGDDDLAREALKQQADCAALAKQSFAATEAHNRIVVQLKDSLRDLNQKLEESKRRRNLLVARVRGAKAKQKMAKALASGEAPGAFGRFDELEDKVSRLEAESEVAVEMVKEFDTDGQRDLEKRFRALRTVDPAIEESLRRLKEQAKPRGALGPGTPSGSDGGTPRD